MVYVAIKEASDDRLHLVREPTVRSWAIFVGLVSLGLGAAYYSGDYLFWKLAYVSGTVFVGLTCLEDWEARVSNYFSDLYDESECILDKTTQKITIKKTSLVQKLFQTEKGQKIVVDDLDGCMSVSVQGEEMKYAGTGYIVVLHFAGGYSLGVTETAVIGDKSEQEHIAEKIKTFLGLDKKDSPGQVPFVDMPLQSSVEEADGAAAADATPGTKSDQGLSAEESTSPPADKQSSTDESDDSFEQIDKDEIANISEIGHDHMEIQEDENTGNSSTTQE